MPVARKLQAPLQASCTVLMPKADPVLRTIFVFSSPDLPRDLHHPAGRHGHMV